MALSMNDLSGLNGAYLKLSGGRRGLVRRPSAHVGLGSVQECGPEPQLQAGEYKTCCPGLGWVIYDASESSVGICARAGGGSSGGSSSGGDLPTDPLERVEELRRRVDEKRAEREAQEFERRKSELQLRFVLGQIQAVQKAEARRVAAEQDREMARLKAAAEKRKRERNQKIALGVGAALILGKALKIY